MSTAVPGVQRAPGPVWVSRVRNVETVPWVRINLRRYPNGKLLIKPGATAIKRFRDRLAKEFRALRGANVAAVLAKIAPITRGSPGAASLLHDVA